MYFSCILMCQCLFYGILCLIVFQAIQKALEARESGLKHFGSRFDHFQKFFSLMRAPIYLRTEDGAHSSKKTKEAATQHSMWVSRAHGPRDCHAANMQAHGACLPWPKSHAASIVPVWLSRLRWWVLVVSHVAPIHSLHSPHDGKL